MCACACLFALCSYVSACACTVSAGRASDSPRAQCGRTFQQGRAAGIWEASGRGKRRRRWAGVVCIFAGRYTHHRRQAALSTDMWASVAARDGYRACHIAIHTASLVCNVVTNFRCLPTCVAIESDQMKMERKPGLALNRFIRNIWIKVNMKFQAVRNLLSGERFQKSAASLVMEPTNLAWRPRCRVAILAATRLSNIISRMTIRN